LLFPRSGGIAWMNLERFIVKVELNAVDGAKRFSISNSMQDFGN
jgi:hypothetical protein